MKAIPLPELTEGSSKERRLYMSDAYTDGVRDERARCAAIARAMKREPKHRLDYITTAFNIACESIALVIEDGKQP